jgi:cell wall-associated NlpC family hydrolase
MLPRESSSDYTDEDLKGAEPVLDVVLGPGDLLYMPRGWIHQACTTDQKGHSSHLTVSVMQQLSWVDYSNLSSGVLVSTEPRVDGWLVTSNNFLELLSRRLS